MSKLLYIIAALVLIAAIVPVHAIFIPTTGDDNSQMYYFPIQVYSAGDPYLVSQTEAEIHEFCAAAGRGHTNDYSAAKWSDNSSRYSLTGNNQGYSVNITADLAYPYSTISTYCSGVWYIATTAYRSDVYTALNANFTAAPTQGSGPLNVALTDTTEYPYPVTKTFNWTITPATGWYVTSGTVNTEDVSIAFVTNGNYTISHGVAAGPYSDIETKTDHVWVYNSTSLVTTPVWALDGSGLGYPIQGAQVDIKDVENGTWSNTTTGANGKGEITTLVGHTLNIYGSATGFDPADLLAQPAYGGGYQLVLFRQGATNVTPGNVTLYVTVVEDDGSFRIPSAEVTAAWGTHYAASTTDGAGLASMTVPNNTAIHVSAFKAGFEGGSKTINSGTGDGGDAHVDIEIRLAKDTITPTVTATTLPGGGTPTPTITADPYPCVGDGSAQDTANCKRKQGEMGASLISYGPQLLLFFIILTFIGGAKMIGK